MRYHAALFAIAALAATSAAQAQTPAAAVPAATEQQVSALYAPLCTAVQDPSDKHLSALFAELAPAFVDVDTKGKQHPRDEVVAAERMQLKQIEADGCTTTFGSITTPDASTMVVISSTHVTGSVNGQDGKHQLDALQKSADTWKLSNGAWQQTNSKDLRALVKIDGTVVQDEGH